MSLRVRRYDAARQEAWDAHIRDAKNGWFLFERAYMDYHADRFTDHSLMIEHDGELLAVLPANEADGALYSHQGLTFGGLIVRRNMTTATMLACFESLHDYAATQSFSALTYKLIPAIYHRLPAEEDRYALFRAGAGRIRCDITSCIDYTRARQPGKRRRHRIIKALQYGAKHIARDDDWEGFFALLNERLREKYETQATHSAEEMRLLASRFPEHIRLYTARENGELLAGAVLYRTPTLAHVQYLAASERGREQAVLDHLCEWLIERCKLSCRYFDFGISNEDQGRYLNEGLIAFKEKFGAQAVAQEQYRWELT